MLALKRREDIFVLPRKFDTTIAHKMLNLMPELSGTDKRVAATIIDHFNRKTGQCDPSIERIARLLGLSRRTVIRSNARVVKTGVLRKVLHGCHLHRVKRVTFPVSNLAPKLFQLTNSIKPEAMIRQTQRCHQVTIRWTTKGNRKGKK